MSTAARRIVTDPALRLPPMPTISDLVKLYRLRARKQLSQNFLMDMNLTNKIVKSVGYFNDCYVCEVGPGPGGITRSILNRGPKKLFLIEKDRRFKPTLELLRECAPDRVDIHYGDVLSFNMSHLFPEEERKDWQDTIPNIRIIGNLPFSISTPLIIRWLRDISQRTNAWSYGRVTLGLTFQHEVAERLVAGADEAQRCRLSIMAQYLCNVYYKFTIPGTAFVPKPEVDVGVVKFIPRKQPLINQPFNLVEKVTRQVFSFRRKYCYNGVETLFPEIVREKVGQEMLDLAEVSRVARPYELQIEEFGRLCDAYAKICEKTPSLRDYEYRGHRPDEIWEEVYGKGVCNPALDGQNEEPKIDTNTPRKIMSEEEQN